MQDKARHSVLKKTKLGKMTERWQIIYTRWVANCQKQPMREKYHEVTEWTRFLNLVKINNDIYWRMKEKETKKEELMFFICLKNQKY